MTHTPLQTAPEGTPGENAAPNATPQIRAVIFDVDGTLIDSNEAHVAAWLEVFEGFGHHVDAAKLRAQMGKGGDQLLPVFLSESRIAEAGKDMEAQRKQIFTEKYLPHLPAFPQVRELVERVLADHKQVVLASSASEEELSRYKEVARIADLVEHATSRDDVAKSKPYPDIFQAALEQLQGVSAADVVVVGDSPYDAQAAAKLGIPTVGLLSGGFEEETLRQAGCIAVYKDAADLLKQYADSPLSK